MKARKKSLWQSFYNSNLFFLFLLIFFLYSAFNVSQEFVRRWQIRQQIQNLNQELTDAQLKKEKLQDLISYLQTDQYIEEQARIQLNLSKAGEKRIDLSTETQAVSLNDDQLSSLPNWQKWFNYFFK